MNDMHGILFAYSSHIRLKELTEHRTAASIPFGGRYRVIDFMLSNMVNANITSVGVIMRESYQSLLDHLGSGKDWDLARKNGGLRILPPFGFAGTSDSVYKGKMDALNGVKSYIDYIRQPYVCLADGDVIANLDLEAIYEAHVKSGAEITCVCTPKHYGDGGDSTYFSIGQNNHVDSVNIGKPEEGQHEFMNVTIMSKPLLEKVMAYCSSHNLYSFKKDVLLRLVNNIDINAYVFDGYCCQLFSIASYYNHSMDLLKKGIRDDLFDSATPIKSKVRDEASAYYGEGSKVCNSVIADGCFIEGTVENSILFRGVHVKKGATVRNCVLMQDTQVEKGAELSYAITDKDVVINETRTLMGHESYPIAISKGVVV